MKRIYSKVFLTAVSLLVSATMAVSVSYAWLVLSQSPTVNGISVMIGGGKTILLAADVTRIVTDEAGNMQTLHYPGKFSDTLNFTACDTYDYLAECGGLMPVSTADGCYWMIPTYDENGNLLPVEKFTVDDKLEYANKSEGGRYVYLDFWVVSPGSEYDLHVSTDRQTLRGSYLVELPAVEKTEDGGLTLAQPQNVVAASARIGFLVNETKTNDNDLTAYLESADYDTRYRTLHGVYQEPGEKADPMQLTSFTTYEPNGTLHTSGETGDSYLLTSPLGYDPFNEKIQETDVTDRLTVQCASTWKEDEKGQLLEQMLQTAIAGKAGLTPREAETLFYEDYLQGQVSPYLSTGLFYQDTAALYDAAAQGTVADVQTAGASDGAVIARLERNTPQRIRMYIWLEGQDPDCRNDSAILTSQIALKLELAGSTP